MVLALTLGLAGSFGHCVGMCSAVILLLNRHPAMQDSRRGWALAHAGRLTSYALLGALVGFAGHLVGLRLGTLKYLQGVISIGMAALAVYFALALLGKMPSPDLALGKLTSLWGKTIRGVTNPNNDAVSTSWLTPYGLGLLWGLLPCGLVLTALFTAAVSTSLLTGALRMLAFGLGTLPALLGVRWLTARGWEASWPRYAAAALMLVFGVQLTFRGLASWGVVQHFMVKGVMLW